jgi:MFS family permease
LTAPQDIRSDPPAGDRPQSASAFWRYWTASTISRVGDAITTVALPLVAVGVLHASSLEVSFLTAAQYAACLAIGLPAGVIVQRLPLRGTQVAMDLLRAAAVVSVPVAAALHMLHPAHLVLVALVIGLATVVFDVGNSTFLPSIVSKEQLTARNSLTSASVSATQLGGPSLGGVLVQFLGGAASPSAVRSPRPSWRCPGPRVRCCDCRRYRPGRARSWPGCCRRSGSARPSRAGRSGAGR